LAAIHRWDDSPADDPRTADALADSEDAPEASCRLVSLAADDYRDSDEPAVSSVYPDSVFQAEDDCSLHPDSDELAVSAAHRDSDSQDLAAPAADGCCPRRYPDSVDRLHPAPGSRRPASHPEQDASADFADSAEPPHNRKQKDKPQTDSAAFFETASFLRVFESNTQSLIYQSEERKENQRAAFVR